MNDMFYLLISLPHEKNIININTVFDKYDMNKDGYLGYPEISNYLNDAMRSQENREAT